MHVGDDGARRRRARDERGDDGAERRGDVALSTETSILAFEFRAANRRKVRG